MGYLLNYLPIAATVFGIPQYLPQIIKLRTTGDTAGVSWSWAMLTSFNNAAWLVYFIHSGYWTAIIPASSATVLAGTVAIMLTVRGKASLRPFALICAWAALLSIAYAVAGRTGLGTLLTAASVIQVTPSLWTAYRTARPTGIARGTWLLILGEVTCWTVYGIHQTDPRLLTLGLTGVIASTLMLLRIRWTGSTRDQVALGSN